MAVTTALSHQDVGAAILQIAAENAWVVFFPRWKPKWTCIANPKGIAHENYKNNKASANTAKYQMLSVWFNYFPRFGSSFGV